MTPIFRHCRHILIAGALAGSALLGGCAEDPVQQTAEPNSTFGLIQAKILNPSCATSGCHVTGAPSAIESGLALETAVAYKNLVGVNPKNADALEDGLKRVFAFKPDSSFLLHKLHGDPGHHGSRNYGNPMPLGRPLLTVGQIEFIRRWIDAGAPETGEVADRTLLNDTTQQFIGEYEPLPVPAAGTGYQLGIDRFGVKPDFERELFIYKKLPNTAPIYVTGYEVRMRPGSHHFVMYTFPEGSSSSILPPTNIIRDIRRPNGTLDNDAIQPMAYHVFLGGSVQSNFRYTFPPGTGLELPPNVGIDLNSHYFNKGTDTIYGEVSANLYTSDRSKIQNVVRVLNLANTTFSLPPNRETTITTNHVMSKAAKVIMLTSHSHKYTKEFVIKIFGGPRDGEVVYRTTDWLHAPFINYPVPIELNKGEGLSSVVTYHNTSNRTIEFGLESEDEMNIIFGYYY